MTTTQQKRFKIIGQRVPKVDAPDKVTGKAAFGADIKLPGMLYGKILRSPYAHAIIKRIDYSKALEMSGVRGVITAADIPASAAEATFSMGENEISLTNAIKLCLAHDKALFHGHPVAVVAADDLYTAEEALKLIEVEYEVLPPVLDASEAMKENAPLLHPEMYTETLGEKPTAPSNIAAHIQLGRGDVERGFAEADVVLENTYRIHIAHQGYIEPEAAMAVVDANGKTTIWTTTQGAFTVKMQIAAIMNIPQNQVKVIPMEVGGAFGGKVYIRLEPLCVLLAKKTGSPVKIVLSREEVLRATGPGSAAIITVKSGAKRDGHLTALETKMIYEAGAFPGSPVAMAVNNGPAPYKPPNVKIDGYDVVTNTPRVSAYRAPGVPQAAFAIEQQMDMMAERLGMDPLEFRLLNAPDTGDPQPNGIPFNRIGLKTILARIKNHPCWTDKLEGPNRGRGLALGFWGGAALTSSAHLTVNPDGTVSVTVGSVDLSSTRTALMQIAAEEFGLSAQEVSIATGDTDSVGYTDVTVGSRTTYTMGTAIHRACQDAIQQMKQRVAARLNVNADDIDYAEKHFYLKNDPTKSISLKDAARVAGGGADGAIIGRGTVTRLQPAPVFGAHVVDVDVDPGTGKVKILRYSAFQDAGLAINPPMVEGQMQGGVTQGIGWGLTEEYIYDENAVMRNASLLDYRMPTALDVPMIDTEIIEVPASDGPFGVRGVGENPIVAPAAALANAIAKATGVRIKEMPMSSERVLWALRAKAQERVTV